MDGLGPAIETTRGIELIRLAFSAAETLRDALNADREGGTAVLVVEDEILIGELVSEELEEAGVNVVTARDADHAISILEAR
ncbi:hypothetical protein [Bradyrhizobium sp. AUGA SZCCT0042]|uniref:hypothetical protein n=1 Tax=Bradyrhizobium sp. AUGA SZCCT0042 TaxID=2807651 RepID=UPI002897D58D|nr:hypothetical protein [Bradyrhizobium sp. AUGA SZCCT0042]